MQYCLVVVPPDELCARISDFQARYVRLAPLAGPHITVKAQGGLSVDENWLAAARTALAQVPSFSTGVDGVGLFGNEVLYLRPEPIERLVQLHALLMRIVNPDAALAKQYYEGAAFIPHLTLAGPGLRQDEIVALKGVAQKHFVKHETFAVNFVRVLKQREAHGLYQAYLDLPLAECDALH